MKYGPGRIKNALAAYAKPCGILFLGCFAFLLSGMALGADQSLKEYIYLHGRLLAIERQTVPITAAKPATGSIEDFFAEAAIGRLLPAATRIYVPNAASAESRAYETDAAVKQGGEETEYLTAQPTVGRGGSYDELSE